jgi:predicted RNase H-like HicB family nuclease
MLNITRLSKDLTELDYIYSVTGCYVDLSSSGKSEQDARDNAKIIAVELITSLIKDFEINL